MNTAKKKIFLFLTKKKFFSCQKTAMKNSYQTEADLVWCSAVVGIGRMLLRIASLFCSDFNQKGGEKVWRNYAECALPVDIEIQGAAKN